jgi:hypothetical protein
MRLDMGAGEAVEVGVVAEAAGAVEEAAPALAVADLVAVVLAVVVVEAAVGAAAAGAGAGAGDTVAATLAAMVGVVAAATDTSAAVVLMVTATNVMVGGSPKAVANTSVTTAGATIAWCAATTDGNELAALSRTICRGSRVVGAEAPKTSCWGSQARGALLGRQLGQRPSGTKPAINIRHRSVPAASVDCHVMAGWKMAASGARGGSATTTRRHPSCLSPSASKCIYAVVAPWWPSAMRSMNRGLACTVSRGCCDAMQWNDAVAEILSRSL